ncbi:MAG: tRNA (N(6)-L-threonylcarbamoyladenosine(37)-C(2))-methylthiotransferase MtaB [Lachnospiraceae bacterium]
MKSVALHNLGCKVNTYELDVMRQKLHENGYSIVSFDEVADIYIVNTCSVTNIADRKSRQMLHQAKKRNPQAVVVATGCYAQTGTRQAEEDEAVDLIIGNNKKKDIVEILEQYFQDHPDKTLHGTTVIDINKTDQYEEMTLKTTTEHTRAYIKIQDGCNQFCSYCIIPYARGRVRSRQEKDILAEVENLVSAGFREIVVTGIHVSSYGMDFDGKKNPVGTEPFDYHRLLSLLQKLNSVEGLSRIRLSSLEPRIITREFAQELVKLEKLCPHFHLSLQSGCDETLQRMNRHYTTGEYLEKVKILRECFPDPAITTDVITGFPGETDEEFEKTKDFLDRVHFYEMHIFPYSKRKGTVAADRKDQVPDRIKKERSSILLEMERKQSAEYRRKWIGKTEEVLLEEQKRIGEEMYQIGHTKNYVKVAVKTDENLSGQLHTGLITGFLQEDLMLME